MTKLLCNWLTTIKKLDRIVKELNSNICVYFISYRFSSIIISQAVGLLIQYFIIYIKYFFHEIIHAY